MNKVLLFSLQSGTCLFYKVYRQPSCAPTPEGSSPPAATRSQDAAPRDQTAEGMSLASTLYAINLQALQLCSDGASNLGAEYNDSEHNHSGITSLKSGGGLWQFATDGLVMAAVHVPLTWQGDAAAWLASEVLCCIKQEHGKVLQEGAITLMPRHALALASTLGSLCRTVPSYLLAAMEEALWSWRPAWLLAVPTGTLRQWAAASSKESRASGAAACLRLLCLKDSKRPPKPGSPQDQGQGRGAHWLHDVAARKRASATGQQVACPVPQDSASELPHFVQDLLQALLPQLDPALLHPAALPSAHCLSKAGVLTSPSDYDAALSPASASDTRPLRGSHGPPGQASAPTAGTLTAPGSAAIGVGGGTEFTQLQAGADEATFVLLHPPVALLARCMTPQGDALALEEVLCDWSQRLAHVVDMLLSNGLIPVLS